ncbi:MAG: hypothetical protein ACHQ0J_01120 [Candidatus Dormibacterales bacterium]
MSERDDELELAALQRQLDDAFATTRPRRAFEDELWLRMQERRPLGNRLRDSIAGLFRGIRGAPVVPAAAVAGVLVVAIGVGVVSLSGAFRPGGSATLSTAPQLSRTADGAFGQVPVPALSSNSKGSGLPVPATTSGAAAPAIEGGALTWAGQASITLTVAPVFRYQEPSSSAADQFASSLGAALQGRPAGFLGSYQSSDYTLRVRGTIQVPPSAPAYFILSDPTMPAVSAAGAAPGDLAALFLAEHGLSPTWPYSVAVDTSNPSLLKVHLLRQFVAPGYGPATLVDSGGMPYGMEVDFNGAQPVLASGPFPVGLVSSNYALIPFDQAVRTVVSAPVAAAGAALEPAVQLTKAELVYVLVPAADHSFYEPAYLFSGSYQVNGVTYDKRVVVPAIDPSRRP